ncbi:hypothetical protein [Rhodopseudomonas palustris]|uniref:hypothetical protein n=1 Tax=Rhodopseudomonas palustris TaxID=1076 RepID=UPI000E5BDBCD|nr:hypothetical protein [Rhodopseudomonas palustris]QLH71654.1 hypothetical protein HZF03_12975 [Rhodopseudomonas palustris]RHZ93581.1 hypothetical protein D1920_20890 [Rhodopseudomonas palustris]
MAQTRERDRAASATKKKRVDPGGKKGDVPIGALRGELKTSAKTNPRSVEKLAILEFLKGYTDGVEKAKKARRPVRFTVEVSPDGSVRAIAFSAALPPRNVSALEASLTAARERGAVKIAEILKGEDMLTATQFGSLIGVSHETVNVKRRRGEVLGLQGATRSVRYPSWQVTDDGRLLPGLPKLFELLGGQPWTVYRFLTAGHPEIGGKSALETMKSGRHDVVFAAAANQMSGNFS